MDIILASTSKRRREILASCGIRHRVVASRAKEDMKISRIPQRVAMINAELKAEKVAGRFDTGYVIGADTVVLLDGDIIGKPRDARHAREMLRRMAGRTISVYTGLCVIDAKKRKKAMGHEKSIVRVKDIPKEDMERYFKLLGPYDKAGGFSIEGAGSFIFDDIKGSYFNVLGLPMAKLKELFDKLGFDILSAVS
ncbi:MAG: Maf family protein [Candidatus Omnitrophota bacterium]